MDDPADFPRLSYFGNFFGETVGVPQPCNLLVPELRRRGLRVRGVSWKRNRILRGADFLAAARNAARNRDLVAVDTFSGASFLWADAVVRITGGRCPTTAVLHGGNLPSYAAKHGNRVRGFFERVQGTVSPSGFLARELEPCAGRRILVIPNPLPLDRYPVRPGNRIADPERPRILWLRAFHEVYEPETAVLAFAWLRKNRPGARLTMIGRDKDGSRSRTREAARKAGVADAVEFRDAVPKDEVPREMNRHDVFLSTARIDNVPVSVTEAMACGMPIVATNVGGVPDLLGRGEAGILVAPGDAGAIGRALLEIIDDPGLAEILGSAARRRAEEHDLERVADAWIGYFRTLIAGGGGS